MERIDLQTIRQAEDDAVEAEVLGTAALRESTADGREAEARVREAQAPDESES